MAVFRGKLYASSLHRPAGFLRYAGESSWQARDDFAIDMICEMRASAPRLGLLRQRQASRLVAMDVATRNTEKMLNALFDLERRERQEEITRQVLELIGARFVSE